MNTKSRQQKVQKSALSKQADNCLSNFPFFHFTVVRVDGLIFRCVWQSLWRKILDRFAQHKHKQTSNCFPCWLNLSGVFECLHSVPTAERFALRIFAATSVNINSWFVVWTWGTSLISNGQKTFQCFFSVLCQADNRYLLLQRKLKRRQSFWVWNGITNSIFGSGWTRQRVLAFLWVWLISFLQIMSQLVASLENIPMSPPAQSLDKNDVKPTMHWWKKVIDDDRSLASRNICPFSEPNNTHIFSDVYMYVIHTMSCMALLDCKFVHLTKRL